jgi:hypothetical protein
MYQQNIAEQLALAMAYRPGGRSAYKLAAGCCGVFIYRCYFLDENRRIIAREDIQAESSEEALAIAWGMYTDRQAKDGFEVWLGSSLIHEEK